MNEAIEAALNLDNWSEETGYASLDSVICPHCKHSEPGANFPAFLLCGVFECPVCIRPYILRHSTLPSGGKVWSTLAPKS